MPARIYVQYYTDPACPWDFCGSPQRLQLMWLYGGQLRWKVHLIGLSESPDDYVRRGYTPEAMAAGHRTTQRRFGMPIPARPRPRLPPPVPACRAGAAAIAHAPPQSVELLRSLRVRCM